MACLIESGVDGTTLDAIAERAGVTRGLVRHYLGNREDVLRSLGAHVRDRYAAWLQDLVSARPPDERLEAVIDALLSEAEPRDLYQLLTALFAAASRDPQVTAMLRDLYREFERTIDSELAAARPRAEPQARRQVSFAILCLSAASSDFQMLGFPRDRTAAARTAAMWLIESLG
jgi:TetR/AcrR family transcriptional regulator, transcriptional repressor of aconitase